MTAAIKRLNTGLYELSYEGRVFQVEDHSRASDGDGMSGWMLYEINKHGEREWWNDFTTKREAIAAVIDELSA